MPVNRPRGNLMNRRRTAVLAILAVLGLLAGACSSDSSSSSSDTTTPSGAGTEFSGTTINVPDDFPTIQEAVNSASPGDLILVGPGVYKEAVDVETPGLTIRGLDRNATILDGEFTRDNGVRILGADNVTVQNMTARNYTGNGFYWTGVEGYHGSYLTAYRNGDYGIYAFDSTRGQFDHSYASGSPDAGFYIGECYPCDAAILDVVSEYNGLGYSGTNSGGNLIIANSEFAYNRSGVVPNSGSYELCYPERDTTVVGNLVHDNGTPDTPAIDVAKLAHGHRHPPGRRPQQPRYRTTGCGTTNGWGSAWCRSPRRTRRTTSPPATSSPSRAARHATCPGPMPPRSPAR